MRPRSAKSPIRGVEPDGGTVGRWTRPEPLTTAVDRPEGGVQEKVPRPVSCGLVENCRFFAGCSCFQAGKSNVKLLKPHFLIYSWLLEWVRWLTEEVYGTSGGSSWSAVCVQIYCLFLNCRILVLRIGWRINLEIVEESAMFDGKQQAVFYRYSLKPTHWLICSCFIFLMIFASEITVFAGETHHFCGWTHHFGWWNPPKLGGSSAAQRGAIDAWSKRFEDVKLGSFFLPHKMGLAIDNMGLFEDWVYQKPRNEMAIYRENADYRFSTCSLFRQTHISHIMSYNIV